MRIPFRVPTKIVTALCILVLSATTSTAQQAGGVGVGNWLTFAANFPEAGYRKTQFFASQWNTGVIEWDSRVELWLPPFRDKFSWGPYLRVAGIAGSQGDYHGVPSEFRSDAWQNAWLGGPGFGIQVYPLSSGRFQNPGSKVGRLFGPLRFFAEYNRTNFWGKGNEWRPRSQTRVGFEYWKAVNVNEPSRYWWAEIWNGLYWQSSNEFTDRYDTVKFANSWRSGIRKTHSGAISSITPYLAIESSRTKYDRVGPNRCIFAPPNPDPMNPNPCDFYWENRLLVGGGIRFAPSLVKLEYHNRAWLNRFAIYGEYLNTAAFYGPVAPSWVPRFDVRVGISASIGHWYK
jgi:hypothetical protein